MARIAIESIIQELKPLNWQLISTEYQNLSNELHFKCPEGHDVYAPWKKMRNQLICPICKQNKFKSDISIPSKSKNTYRILALDQASKISGWAILDNKELIKYGIFEADNLDEVPRFNQIKQWLVSMITNIQPDMIGLEGIQYQENMGVTTFQTLARLQGILMETCYELKIPFMICPTNTWRAHCQVKGRTRMDKKHSMQSLVKQWFDITVQDDIADAIGIGKYVADTYMPQINIVNWE